MRESRPSKELPYFSLPERDASFCRALALKLLSKKPEPKDIEEVSFQLGRKPEGMAAVGARQGGSILAVIVKPLAAGRPFPTVFYLVNKNLVRRVSSIESAGAMKGMCQRIRRDEPLRARLERAHLMYLKFRSEVGELTGSSTSLLTASAGGMPERVKCLHALLAQSLVMGPGINPIGDEVAHELGIKWQE